MKEFDNNFDEFEFEETKSFKDYLRIIRNNLNTIIFIIALVFIASVVYAVNSKDIFKASTTLKLTKPQGSILQAPLVPEFQDFGADRFIANEIEVLKSYNLRERAARALIDSFRNSGNNSNFFLIFDRSDSDFNNKIYSISSLAKILSDNVNIEQKRGLDIIEISAESPAAFEAALIAKIYAKEYRNFNLEVNRNQLTFIKNFLQEQRNEKQNELNEAEETLRNFQEKGGVIALDEQATALINQLSQFEAQRDASQIELMASTAVLDQYKDELQKQDPRLAGYLESVTSEAYITGLQKQIAELQINRDLALANVNPNIDISAKVKEYETRIDDLKEKLNEKISVIKEGIFASSPAEVKELSQKIIEEEVKNRSLRISRGELEQIVARYEERFERLPKTSLELARFQRKRESLEKLYTLVEEKYQEALINEQSQPGNVYILDEARTPSTPSKPNRFLIILIGIVLGTGLSLAYVFIKEYFDNTIKSPDDIERKNIDVLAWIPQIDAAITNGFSEYEFIIARKPDSVQSEAFRALRTRIQFSRLDAGAPKTILVTSTAPQEGKTFVTVNLAGSFAQANYKTVIIDGDLRKPRIHTLFGKSKTPGLIEYLFKKNELDEVIFEAEIPNLFYIASGTIPPNPAEMLGSKQMKEFLTKVKEKFDVVIIDSPPVIAVTDSELLARQVDGTLLVVSSDSTEMELMERAVELIKHDKSGFLGTVLNNFTYKAGYGSYYKYYYYYPSKKESSIKKIKK